MNDKLFNDKIVDSGYGVVNDDPYITIGKYLVHKQHLLGGKVQVRSPFNHNQVKSNEDKLKDKFYLLRGSIMAGNNNPQLLRKFKIVQLKMKNNELISLQEYNEIINILLELDI